MSVIRTDAQIRTALAAMDPVARSAAREFAALILDGSRPVEMLLKNPRLQRELFTQACWNAFSDDGGDTTDGEAFQEFVQEYGEEISRVACSAVCNAIEKDARSQRQ